MCNLEKKIDLIFLLQQYLSISQITEIAGLRFMLPTWSRNTMEFLTQQK